MFLAETVPRLETDLSLGAENWEQKKSRIIPFAERLPRRWFFRGPPSTGKSYLTEQLGRDLGFEPATWFGPVTVGVMSPSPDLLGKNRGGERPIVFRDGPVGQWVPAGPAARPGKLFIVDEANLVRPGFLGFYERASTRPIPTERYVWVNGEKRWFASGDRVISP